LRLPATSQKPAIALAFLFPVSVIDAFILSTNKFRSTIFFSECANPVWIPLKSKRYFPYLDAIVRTALRQKGKFHDKKIRQATCDFGRHCILCFYPRLLR